MGLAVGKTKRGKGTKIMASADASGFPVAACVESASPHEVKLVEKTIDSSFTPYAPEKIIGDKAYDSDPLDKKLMEDRCIVMRGCQSGKTLSFPKSTIFYCYFICVGLEQD